MALIYGLKDSKYPKKIRYVGTHFRNTIEELTKEEKTNIVSSDGDNSLNLGRRKWIEKVTGRGGKIKVIPLIENTTDIYYELKMNVRELTKKGEKLFNSKYLLMDKKTTKLEELRIKHLVRKMNELFPDINFVGMYEGSIWCVMCNNYKFYSEDRKFKIWSKILRKKTPVRIVFAYSSKADRDKDYLKNKYKEYKFV